MFLLTGSGVLDKPQASGMQTGSFAALSLVLSVLPTWTSFIRVSLFQVVFRKSGTNLGTTLYTNLYQRPGQKGIIDGVPCTSSCPLKTPTFSFESTQVAGLLSSYSA